MADKIIPPRRGEEITPGGTGNTRLMEYLEENARQTNENTSLTEGDPSSVNMSVGALAFLKKQIASVINEGLTSDKATIEKLNKKIACLESDLLITTNSKLLKKIEQLENTMLNQSSSKLLKKIEQLENSVLNSQSSKLNKRITALENDFMAPVNSQGNVFNEITVASGEWNSSGIDVTIASSYFVGGTQVLTQQGANVNDAAGGATIDTEARLAINTLLARVRVHGIIA